MVATLGPCMYLIAILFRHRVPLWSDESFSLSRSLFLNSNLGWWLPEALRARDRRRGSSGGCVSGESTRTGRDLAPDASFAAQAGGFFFRAAARSLETRLRGSQHTDCPRATCRDDALLTIWLSRVFVTRGKGERGDRQLPARPCDRGIQLSI